MDLHSYTCISMNFSDREKYFFVFLSEVKIISFLKAFLHIKYIFNLFTMGPWREANKSFQLACVAVPPVPVRVNRQRPLAPNVMSVSSLS